MEKIRAASEADVRSILEALCSNSGDVFCNVLEMLRDMNGESESSSEDDESITEQESSSGGGDEAPPSTSAPQGVKRKAEEAPAQSLVCITCDEVYDIKTNTANSCVFHRGRSLFNSRL